MPIAATRNERLYFTAAEISNVLQTNIAAVKKIIRDHNITPSDIRFTGQRKHTEYYYLPHCLINMALVHPATRDYMLRHLRPPGQEEHFDLEAERAAKTHYEKELAKLKLREQQDNLFTLEEVTKLSEEICLPIKQFLLSLPSLMTNRLGSENLDIVQQFEQDIHEKLIPLLDNGIAGSLQKGNNADMGTAAAASEAND